MKSIDCPNCGKPLNDKAFFCGKCGTQAKCTNCNEQISSEDKYCEACGVELRVSNKVSETSNTFEFQETKESRSIKASFTNPAVKDMSETLGIFLTNRKLGLGQSTVVNHGDTNSEDSENIIDIDTYGREETIGKEKTESKSLGQEIIGELPNLKNIVYKRLPNSESEWMLIYACYSTNFELAPVTPDVLREYYVNTGRKTDSTRRNFGTNLNSLVNQGFIEFINDDEFVVTEEGFAKAKEILARTSGNKPKKSKPRKKSAEKSSTSSTKSKSSGKSPKTSSKSPAKQVTQERFNTHHEDKSLSDFFKEKAPGKSTYNRILVIGYYINFILKSSSFSDGNIDYAYRALKLNDRPKHLRQTIRNMKNNYAYIEETGTEGSWKLSRNGEIFVEEELPKK